MRLTHIARSALIIAVFLGLEKLLGFVRQLIIARQFGLTASLDVFNAANNLPDLIFGLISGGALAIAFIPILSEYLEEHGRPQMWDLFSRVANIVFLVTAGLSAFVAIYARQLVGSNLGIAPGFSPDQQALVVNLMRLNLVATLLFSISGLIIAGLQANQHFLLPALAKSMYDIGTLIGVLILAPETGYQIGPITLPALGLGVYGLAYGTVLGAVLFLGIQIPGLIRYGFRWVPAIDLHHPGVRKVLRIMIPRIGNVFFIYLVLVYIPDNIASSLPEGSITALVYGWLIMQVPESLIGTALGTALLPSISEQITRQERMSFTSLINRAVRVLLAFTLPISVLIAIGVAPLVDLFGFDPIGSSLVVWTTRAFLVGLVGHTLLEIGARGFYAQQNAVTPLLASILMAATFTMLAVGLSKPYGAAGIALANSIAFSGEALLLLFLLNRKFPGLLKLGQTLPRVIAATLVGGVTASLMVNFLPLHPIISAIVALGSGAITVLPFIWPEMKTLAAL